MSSAPSYSTIPLDSKFESCIKCTICTVYCPVSKVNPNFSGPKASGPDGERLRIKSRAYYDPALKACTNCKRCETACPSGVKIGDIIAKARGQYEKKSISPKLVRDFILSHTDLFGHIATPFAPIANRLTQLPLIKKIMHHTVGVHEKKSLPRYAHGTFRQWFKKHAPDQSHYSTQVAYYHGCYVNYNFPQQGKELVQVMNAFGFGVALLDKEKCCGVPLIANGFHNKALKNAQLNVRTIEGALASGNSAVVSTSSTCSFTLQEEYPHVLSVDNGSVKNHIVYVTRFLLEAMMNGHQPNFRPVNLRLVYHIPCHMEKSGNHIFTIELLKQIPGVELIVLDSACCGLAGTYGFKTENYKHSIAIGRSLFETINSSNADYVVSDCETCKWQIEENTNYTCLHPIGILALALAK
ncbi:anaerobic glycerol-3-phosphate dehydrogenase subunit GlpC [Vibrio nomapromontoriensis]|uniref:anaerobic glycerol-3-phosphate dehydrogenase subunit GlpC n=1 Tax=Vibrio nomapromontoriensis TaxID=2910246 RepID=UPI003D1322D1